MKIIFIGTPKFASTILEKLIEGYKPSLVITAPDKPAGRKQLLTPPEVKTTAERYNIPVMQPEKIKDIEEEIKKIEPDLIILTAYGQIIPKSILDIPRFKSINIHPSLLPKYRGASPIQSAILNGDKETGVSIYIMDEKMDHGSVIAKTELKITNPKVYYEELAEELAGLGAELLLKNLPKILKNEIKPEDQDDSKATYTKIIIKEDGHIDWNKNAEEIERQIRAFHIWPTSFTLWEKNGKILRIKIIKAEIKNTADSHPCGKIISSSNEELLIRCKESFLDVKEMQLEGKKPMSPKEFLMGYPDIIGVILK